MSFNIDQDMSLTESGAWLSFGGSKFLVAHLSSIRFQRELAHLQQPYRRKIDSGTMDPQVSKELLCKAMAKGLVLDWQNVTNGAGEQVPYSFDAALRTLLKNPEFREMISEFATNLDNFRQVELEEVGKSS